MQYIYQQNVVVKYVWQKYLLGAGYFTFNKLFSNISALNGKHLLHLVNK